MTSEAVIGPVVTGQDVEAAMEALVRKWQADYLAAMAEKSGRERGDLPRFASFTRMADLAKFTEDALPACIIIAPGTVDVPTRKGNAYNARSAVGVGCAVSGQDVANTYELTGLYLAAVRTAVLQHRSLDGFAADTLWMGERYDELASNDARTIMAGVAQFNVEVERVVDLRLGLLEPTPDATLPPGAWPVAETITVTTTGTRS